MRPVIDPARDRPRRAAALRLVAGACAVVQTGCFGASLGRQVVEIRQQVDDLEAERGRIREALEALASSGTPREAPLAGAGPIEAGPGAPMAGGTAPRSGTALYREAYLLFHRGQYEEAERRLRAFLAADPGGSLAPDTLYWIAECLRARGRSREAVAEFRSLLDLRPPGDLAARALYGIAMAWESLGEIEAARNALRDLVRDFPGSDVATLARQRLQE